MYFTLVHFPNIDYSKINRLRKQYDPTYRIIDPHITVMFPVPVTVDEEKIINHIQNVLRNWKSFPIHITGLVKSWDHWLFLTMQEGRPLLIQLYREIYSGMMTKWKREDIEYIPHIGLGLFLKEKYRYNVKDPKKLELAEISYVKAHQEAESLDLDYTSDFNQVNLIKLNGKLSKIIWNQKTVLKD